jgi:hypothetical protein
LSTQIAKIGAKISLIRVIKQAVGIAPIIDRGEEDVR